LHAGPDGPCYLHARCSPVGQSRPASQSHRLLRSGTRLRPGHALASDDMDGDPLDRGRTLRSEGLGYPSRRWTHGRTDKWPGRTLRVRRTRAAITPVLHRPVGQNRPLLLLRRLLRSDLSHRSRQLRPFRQSRRFAPVARSSQLRRSRRSVQSRPSRSANQLRPFRQFTPVVGRTLAPRPSRLRPFRQSRGWLRFDPLRRSAGCAVPPVTPVARSDVAPVKPVRPFRQLRRLLGRPVAPVKASRSRRTVRASRSVARSASRARSPVTSVAPVGPVAPSASHAGCSVGTRRAVAPVAPWLGRRQSLPFAPVLR